MTPEEHDYLAREAKARVEIDRQLKDAGWAVQDQNALNLGAGVGVAVREFALEQGHGRVDYLLFLNGQPAGVIEAKPEGTTLIEVEHQSGKYVDGLPEWMKPPIYPLPFIYESTGAETRFTNGYDAADNLTQLLNGTTQAFDPANQLLTSTGVGNQVTTFSYDQNGNRIGQTPAKNITGNKSASSNNASGISCPNPPSNSTGNGGANSGNPTPTPIPTPTPSSSPSASPTPTLAPVNGGGNTPQGQGSSNGHGGGKQVKSQVKAVSTNNCDPSSPPANPSNQGQPDLPTTYTYDQANRLTNFNNVASYTYNGDGLRMSKAQSSQTQQFTWDLAEGLPLTLSDSQNQYIYGPGGLPIEQISSSGQIDFFHHDQLGSTRLLTDKIGHVEATFTFDPYGNFTTGSLALAAAVTNSPNPAVWGQQVESTVESCKAGLTAGQHGIGDCVSDFASTHSAQDSVPDPTNRVSTPFLFSGQYRDSESGLYYLRARYYDPATAQFIGRDPASAITRSPYAYVTGNPLNDSDPSGLCLWLGCWINDQLHQNGMCNGWVDQNCAIGADTFVRSDFGKFANGWANGVTLGASSWAESLSANGRANLAVDRCSGWYTAGNVAGIATGAALGAGVARAAAAGREVFIPFTRIKVGLGVPGAKTAEGERYWAARLPHYHRRITGPGGEIPSGGGFGWHRPWQGW